MARRAARPFRAEDPPAPADPYGRAKLGIEAAMASGGVPLVVLRPPLVYGPGVKGNFRALLRLVARGVPLPLASVANRRSLVFLDNLLDLVELALQPRARARRNISGARRAGGLDTRADPPDRGGAWQAGAPVPCPPAVLRAAARLVGRGDDARRLLEFVTVDDAPTRDVLGWRPRVTLEEGVAATCRWYRG